MLEGSNIQVYDLGADVPPEEFIHAAREHHCDIIACSALLTTTMQQMRQVVDLAREAGIRDRVCIMVGGAPISQSFCDEIHADLYTPDAASAARRRRTADPSGKMKQKGAYPMKYALINGILLDGTETMHPRSGLSPGKRRPYRGHRPRRHGRIGL